MAVFQPSPNDDPAPLPPRKGESLWNALTFLVLAALVVVLVVFSLIFTNPSVAFNPYPPPTQAVLISIPTTTPTIPPVPPTLTFTVTITPTYTLTSPPPTITATFIGGELALTTTPTPQDNALYAFTPRGEPEAWTASAFNGEHDSCEWMGVAGRVVDMQERPVVGVIAQLGGTTREKTYLKTTLTGTALNYGVSGYELTIDDERLFDTKQLLWVRLLDQAGLPLSAKIHFDTFNDCSKNLILINFKQVR